MAEHPTPLTDRIHADLMRLLSGEPSQDALVRAMRLLGKWRAHLIENTVLARDGAFVQSGPFKGMRYDQRASEGARVARLLGCYEAALHPVIEEIVAAAYPLVIDIGSAEGYYAVGLARRMPETQVWARDADEAAQTRCRALAGANGVADRVQVGGLFAHADFDLCTAQPTVVICDIEGAEAELLDPDKAPVLRAADILVEVHEAMRPGLVEALIARFQDTHQITRFDRKLDDSALPDWMTGLSDMDRLIALWEWRGGQTPWLWMKRYE